MTKPIVLAMVATLLLATKAEAQPYPWYAEFGGICILPRQGDVWYVPFDGIDVGVWAPAESILATFPHEWQGRTRIGVLADVREPGMLLKFTPPLDLGVFVIRGEPEFDPPPPWPSPLDSLRVNWPPWESIDVFDLTVFSNQCKFLLGGGPGFVTVDATVNLVGVYASDVDTAMVWGTEFGWPDLRITDEGQTVIVSVEQGTWGRIKANMLERSR